MSMHLRSLVTRALLVASLLAAIAANATPLQSNFDCPAMIVQGYGSMKPGEEIKVTIFTKADGNCVLGLHCVSTVGVRGVGSSIGDFKVCWIDALTNLRHCATGPLPALYIEFTLEAACGATATETIHFYDSMNGETGSGTVSLYCDACG